MKIVKSLLVVAVLSASVWALPPQVEGDRLFLKAKEALDTKDYVTVVENFDKLQKLGVKLPDTFSYHYGTALLGIGDLDEALKMFDSYLAQGSTAKFYKEALIAYNKTEEAYKKMQQADKALQDKKEAERQAVLASKMAKIWIDKSTGLTWQDNEEVTTVKKDWQGAIDYCENLTLSGYRDWQLPDKNTLVDLSTKKSNLKNLVLNYWSSSSVVDNSRNSWMVHFYYNNPNENPKDYIHYIRCVRNSN